jgi:hypothetical protein
MSTEFCIIIYHILRLSGHVIYPAIFTLAPVGWTLHTLREVLLEGGNFARYKIPIQIEMLVSLTLHGFWPW